MPIASAVRAIRHTTPAPNERTRRGIEDSIARYAFEDRARIGERLAALDREWDIERLFETNAGVLVLAGAVLGITSHRRWFLLPAAVAAFLLQHAIQGWCPPVELLRRLGFRTRREIDLERYALKALRGDFREVDQPTVREWHRAQARRILEMEER